MCWWIPLLLFEGFFVLSCFLSCALKSLVLPRNLRPYFILSEVRSSLHCNISTKHHGPSSALAPTVTWMEASLLLMLLIRFLSILPYCSVFAFIIYYNIIIIIINYFSCFTDKLKHREVSNLPKEVISLDNENIQGHIVSKHGHVIESPYFLS